MLVIALEANQKYYTTSELKNMGYSYYKISQMKENGQLCIVRKNGTAVPD